MILVQSVRLRGGVENFFSPAWLALSALGDRIGER